MIVSSHHLLLERHANIGASTVSEKVADFVVLRARASLLTSLAVHSSSHHETNTPSAQIRFRIPHPQSTAVRPAMTNFRANRPMISAVQLLNTRRLM